MILAGGLFLMAILATVGLGLLTGWDQRSGYIMTGFDVLLTVGFLMAWVRLEIVKGEIELMDNLQIGTNVIVAGNVEDWRAQTSRRSEVGFGAQIHCLKRVLQGCVFDETFGRWVEIEAG
jgi:hypothetical protein